MHQAVDNNTRPSRQEHYGRLLQQRTGDGDALLLPARELRPRLLRHVLGVSNNQRGQIQTTTSGARNVNKKDPIHGNNLRIFETATPLPTRIPCAQCLVIHPCLFKGWTHDILGQATRPSRHRCRSLRAAPLLGPGCCYLTVGVSVVLGGSLGLVSRYSSPWPCKACLTVSRLLRHATGCHQVA